MESKEREKRLAIQKMKTSLWTQRREKDGRLLQNWKKIDEENQDEDDRQPPSVSSQEEESKWMEELELTELERRKLEDLEKKYYEKEEIQPSGRSTSLSSDKTPNSSKSHDPSRPEPSCRPEIKKKEDMQPSTKNMKKTSNIRIFESPAKSAGKVKTDPSLNSPVKLKNLKRLNPRTKTPLKPAATLSSPSQANRKTSFKKLLNCWEERSTSTAAMLTPYLLKGPSLEPSRQPIGNQDKNARKGPLDWSEKLGNVGGNQPEKGKKQF